MRKTHVPISYPSSGLNVRLGRGRWRRWARPLARYPVHMQEALGGDQDRPALAELALQKAPIYQLARFPSGRNRCNPHETLLKDKAHIQHVPCGQTGSYL